MSSGEHDDDGKKKEKAEYKAWPGWGTPSSIAEAEDLNFDEYDVDNVKWDGYLQIEPKPLHSTIYTRDFLKRTHLGFKIDAALSFDMVSLKYVYRYVTYKGRCLLAIARTVEEAEAVLGDPVMLAAVCAKQVKSWLLYKVGGGATGLWFNDETMGDDSNG